MNAADIRHKILRIVINAAYYSREKRSAEVIARRGTPDICAFVILLSGILF
jgi:hypothetical protein